MTRLVSNAGVVKALVEDSAPASEARGTRLFTGRGPPPSPAGSRRGPDESPVASENTEDGRRHACQAHAGGNVPGEAADPEIPNIGLFMDFRQIIQVYWQLQHFP